MRKAIVLAVAVLLMASGTAMAQKKVEVSGLVGWTFSDGVAGDGIKAPDGNVYNSVDLKDSVNYGFMLGIMATDNFEVGFLFNRQQSGVTLGGTQTRFLGDMGINTYHGYVAYDFGEADAKFRPYILGGIGATNFGKVNYTNAAGASATLASTTRFSTTWGGGIKYFPAPSVGLRVGLRWTPTYITTDSAGWWCDPYWGCWVVGNAKYANQVDFSGGVTIRF
jgi:opacity protein-like surface antigen